jgi:hypothetical protein
MAVRVLAQRRLDRMLGHLIRRLMLHDRDAGDRPHSIRIDREIEIGTPLQVLDQPVREIVAWCSLTAISAK